MKLLKLRAKAEFLDVRPPARIVRANDGLQVIVFVPAPWIQILRASGLGGMFVRQFCEIDEDLSLYRAVPMSVDTALTTCLGQAQFL